MNRVKRNPAINGRSIKFGSVCSGISSESVAWKSLGWTPAWFSEIAAFPSRVLKTRYPGVLNLGDMTKVKDTPIFQETDIDILIGGTPCQSFSLGGKRLGLDDPRGNLALEFLRLVQIKRPHWVVCENVPGVLSKFENSATDNEIETKLPTDESELQDTQIPAFSEFIHHLQDCGYGFAWRVLDAQYFGVPQQRRRLFVVAHSSGSWNYPAAVLFDENTFDLRAVGSTFEERGVPTLTLRNAGNSNARGVVIVEEVDPRDGPAGQNRTTGRQIRACTPWEEERRQGFSGTHTKIEGASDSDRYEAIGNSMAIPVMTWIGERIQAIESTKPLDIAPLLNRNLERLEC